MQALVACVAGIIMARMLGFSVVAKVAFYATFPLTVALWIWTMRRGVTILDYLAVGTVALAAVCVLLDLWRSGGALSFAYLKKLAMFAMTLIFLCAADRCRPGAKLAQFVQIVVDVLTILMVVMLFLAYDQMFMIGGKISRYMTLGFSNPNSLSLFVTCMYMLTFCSFSRKQSSKQRSFRAAVLTAQIFILLGSRCRTGQMIAIAFTAAALCVLYRQKIHAVTGIAVKMHFRLWQAAVIAIFPMVFAVIYMIIVDAEWVQKLFSFVVSEGKGINSRVKEWTPAFDAIRYSPWIGAYYLISNGTGSSQLHNTHADTAASYGIPAMLLISVMLTLCIHQKGKKYNTVERFLYMGGFCCAMLMGTFEAAVFSGGLGIYIFAVIFLSLAKCEEDLPEDDGWYRIGQRLKQAGKRIFARGKK